MPLASVSLSLAPLYEKDGSPEGTTTDRNLRTRMMVVQLKIYGPRGEEKVMDVCETKEQLMKMSGMHLKKSIQKELAIENDIRMVFKTETLEEKSLLGTYDIKHLSNIQTLLLLPGGM